MRRSTLNQLLIIPSPSLLRDLRNKITWKKISINLTIQTAAAAYVETKQSKKHGLFQNRNDTFSSVDVRINLTTIKREVKQMKVTVVVGCRGAQSSEK